MRSLSHHIILSVLILYCSVHISRFSSCTSNSNQTASNQNVSKAYKTEKEVLHPSYAVFHRTGTISELHFKINSKELLYSKQTGSESFTARMRIHYRLISSYETKDIIDSATVNLTDLFSNTPKDIIGKLDFSATFTNSYLLQVDLFDLNRNTTARTLINIDKLNHSTRQNYIVLSQKKKIPVFRNYLRTDEYFHIKYRDPSAKLNVRYYQREFPLPAPPFSTSNMMPFEYRADKIFSIQQDEKDTMGFTFSEPGFYHIQSDTFSKEGLTLFRFNNDFPQIKKPLQLLEPLRYLTSRQEYEAMSGSKSIKTAVDSFWVAAGGSHERARELVKKFYNRIEDSNNYFSSYLEGWRTDRGLIYIVYGPPNIVYKTSDSENWVYGEENNFNSLSFTFLKVINPFTDNDFRLERNQSYRTSWLNAVDMWRQGRVYAEK
jgi:GWxTD domain-containing protein